jgi:hypothetical protein
MLKDTKGSGEASNGAVRSVRCDPISSETMLKKLLISAMVPFAFVCCHSVVSNWHHAECKSSVFAIFLYENARFCYLVSAALKLIEKAAWCFAISVARELRGLISWILAAEDDREDIFLCANKSHRHHHHHNPYTASAKSIKAAAAS